MRKRKLNDLVVVIKIFITPLINIQIWLQWLFSYALQWRHNDHDSFSNHQPRGCLLNRLFRRRSKKTSKLRVTGLCVWNSPGTGEFPAEMASNADNVSIWWRHHVDPNGYLAMENGRAIPIHLDYDWFEIMYLIL